MAHLEIMGSRYQFLEWTLKALDQVRVPLVQYNNGVFEPSTYVTGGSGDDEGIYYFIPALAKTFGISLDLSIKVFFFSLVLVAVAGFLWGFFLMFKSTYARLAALLASGLLSLLTVHIWDVYVVQVFAVAAVVPMFLYLCSNMVGGWRMAAGLAWAGLVCGYSDFIRTQSGIGVLLFVLAFIGLNRCYSMKEKCGFAAVLFLFFAVPALHFKALESQRDRFLRSADATYQSFSAQHPFWHAIYAGLGYLPNRHGIEWSDTSSSDKVKSIDPSVKNNSPEYEKILRGQVLLLAKDDPAFILENILVKSLKLVFYLVLFSNLGLAAAFRLRPPWTLWVPFVVLAAFGSLPGLVTIPVLKYVLTMVSTAAVFGVFMLGTALEKGWKRGGLN